MFRRNLIGLLVVMAALATLYVTKYHDNWSVYRNSMVPEATGAPGETVTADDVTWGVEKIRYVRALPGYSAGHPLPEGTGAAIVTVKRQGAPTDTGCTGVLTDGVRRWKAEGVGFSAAPLPDGTTDNCTKPGPVQFTFILPRDASPTAVDILDYRGRITVRLPL